MVLRQLSMGFAVALFAFSLSAAEWVPPTLKDYLPAGVTYDETIPKPFSVLGFEVGEWHVRHDQLVNYLEVLAGASNRVAVSLQGRTHEGRPQLLLTITSPENHRRLREIRQRHLAHAKSTPARETASPQRPVVVWLGYSIHGDEASGSNASLLVAYHLAAAQGEAIEALLSETVVLLDPSLNPDGLGRFAQWANSHRGRQPAAAADHREHRQAWPGGRTNHYWFDLNRDWLLQQHPESWARLQTLRSWQPNLLGDYHEMGSDQTYFFQPGVPNRVNPLIPPANLELTRRIAHFHAEALNKARTLYFSEESFDDFYPGKGSTYPDLTGGIGVLFEQGSTRGHRHETPRGTREFPQAIRNHFLTSLSMLRAGQELREELLGYQEEFFNSARNEARKDSTAGWLVQIDGDPARSFLLQRILWRHGIQISPLSRRIDLEEQTFGADTAFFVAADQDSYRLARSLFEVRINFASTTFYDVSTWNLPMAFGAQWAPVKAKTLASLSLGEPLKALDRPPGSFSSADATDTFAFLIEASQYFAHRTLNRILAAGFQAQVATRPFEANTDSGPRRFDYGTLVIPGGATKEEGKALVELLRRAAAADSLKIYRTDTGLTPSGVDLGSPSLRPLRQPKPVLVVGSGVSPYESGEVWHLLDYRFGLEVSLVEGKRLAAMNLGPFTHLLMVDGDYKKLSKEAATKILSWVRQGGIVVATKRGGLWARSNLRQEIEAANAREEKPVAIPGQENEVLAPEPPPRAVYADFEPSRQAQRISGAAFEVELDLSHPLAFGYRRGRLPIFRNSAKTLEPSPNPYETPFFYSSQPLLSGYASQENLEKIAGSPAVVVRRLGSGAVIQFADDLNFRGFWYGTNKLYLNALFFGSVIQATPPRSDWE